jgi:hypothetical protein
MNDLLEARLRSELALLASQRQVDLIRKAHTLYGLGFRPEQVSASQMASVGELIRRAETFDKAAAQVGSWMANNLAKLRARRARTNRVESWLISPKGGQAESLGDLLVDWIVKQRFLEPEPPPEELDRLEALRQFWGRFHGLYRFQAETGRQMPLLQPASEDRS